MRPTLILSPTTERSVAHATGRARGLQGGNLLAPVAFLLPTAEDIALMRVRLSDSLGFRLHQFYGIAGSILDQAASPHHRIRAAAARRLVRDILAGMSERGELTTFAPVWEKPGFHQVLLEWLREMKSQGISPEELAGLPPGLDAERDRQMATIYARYQAHLQQHDQTDGDGLLWLAADALEADPSLRQGGEPLIVLGFDQFSRMQMRLLRLLAPRLASLDTYLLWDAMRPEGSLALSRLRQTRRDLTEALSPLEELLPDDAGGPPVLTHLRHTVLEPGTGAVADDDATAVVAVEAPSREAEVRAALRAVKRLLLDGVAPMDIALLAPRPAKYRHAVQAVAQEYGLPIHVEQPLVESPAVAALLNLLVIHPDLPWRPTIDALRSPYVAQGFLKPAQIDSLERLTRERPVLAGLDQWRCALTPLRLDPSDVDEELGPPPLVATMEPRELAVIDAGLTAFFGLLTPLPVATWAEHALWLQRAILGLPETGAADDEGGSDGGDSAPDSLRLVACCRGGAFDERDLRAMAEVVAILGDLVDAAGSAGEDAWAGGVAWEEFRSDLINAIRAASLPPDPDLDAVWFGPLESGRNRAVQHLLVVGLSEGEFPRQPRPDAFYTAEERAAHPLPLVRPSPGEDAGLWWQLVSGCSRRLTLLRPRLDESGAEWLPSPYWTDLVGRVAGLAGRVERLPITSAIRPGEAASPGELLAALSTAHADAVPPDLHRPWENARRGYRVTARRRSWQSPGPHEGVFHSPDLLKETDRRYGPEHTWSASRLGDYGACPFLFFARAGLKLEPLPDPEAGMDVRQLGRLYHAILEDLYGRLMRDGIAPSPATAESVRERLDSTCLAILPGAPARFGFRPGELWEHEKLEIRRILGAFVAWECSLSDETWRPYRQEWRFGLSRGSRPPLLVGNAFYLHGVIDRIDRDKHGRLRIVDYKTGSTTLDKSDIEEGRAVQTALYALAAAGMENCAGVSESAYLHILPRKKSGRLEFPEDTARQALCVAAAAGFVAQARAGRFPTAPAGGKCPAYCDMASLCRRDRQAVAKGGRAMESWQ